MLHQHGTGFIHIFRQQYLVAAPFKRAAQRTGERCIVFDQQQYALFNSHVVAFPI
jgi:DNA-binding MurR/RpiR family transcriptional regulator